MYVGAYRERETQFSFCVYVYMENERNNQIIVAFLGVYNEITEEINLPSVHLASNQHA